MNDAIDGYLDRLAERAHDNGARVRRVLAECETHLLESAAQLRASGLSEQEAAAEAVARFGAPETVAQAMRPRLREVATDAVRATWLLGAVGLLAIGSSGLLAWLLRLLFGDRFLAGDGFGVTYTPARCADFLEYFPRAGSCAAAAAMHHSDEVVSYRIAAGVLGVAALVAYLWYRRRRGTRRVLPATVVPVAAAVLFGVAAGLLLLDAVGLGIGEATHREPIAGVGDPLSAGVVALIAAAVAGTVAIRRILQPHSAP